MTATNASDAEQSFEAAVRAQCARFARNYAAGDFAGLVAGFYNQEACLLGPGMPFLEGPAALSNAFQNMKGSGIEAVTLEPVRLRAAGDLGYEIGRARLTIVSGGAKVEQVARYVVVWRRTDGVWRAECDMFALEAI